MLGTALSWRQSEENKGWGQDGVNVRQPKVICALYLEMFWYAEESMPVNTNQCPLWAQFDAWLFKYSCFFLLPFFLLTVCMHFNSALLWRYVWNRSLPVAMKPWSLSLIPWFQILITSSVLFVPVPSFSLLISQPSTVQAHQHKPYFVKFWWFTGASLGLLFLVWYSSLIKHPWSSTAGPHAFPVYSF